MLHYLDALNLLAAVNARHQHIRTRGFVLVDFLADAFSLTKTKSLTFDRSVSAVLIVVLNFCVCEHSCATKGVVVAHKFHIL